VLLTKYCIQIVQNAPVQLIITYKLSFQSYLLNSLHSVISVPSPSCIQSYSTLPFAFCTTVYLQKRTKPKTKALFIVVKAAPYSLSLASCLQTYKE